MLVRPDKDVGIRRGFRFRASRLEPGRPATRRIPYRGAFGGRYFRVACGARVDLGFQHPPATIETHGEFDVVFGIRAGNPFLSPTEIPVFFRFVRSTQAGQDFILSHAFFDRAILLRDLRQRHSVGPASRTSRRKERKTNESQCDSHKEIDDRAYGRSLDSSRPFQNRTPDGRPNPICNCRSPAPQKNGSFAECSRARGPRPLLQFMSAGKRRISPGDEHRALRIVKRPKEVIATFFAQTVKSHGLDLPSLCGVFAPYFTNNRSMRYNYSGFP